MIADTDIGQAVGEVTPDPACAGQQRENLDVRFVDRSEFCNVCPLFLLYCFWNLAELLDAAVLVTDEARLEQYFWALYFLMFWKGVS